MQRSISALAAACALGAGLAACGGSDDEAGGCSPAISDLTVTAEDSLLFGEDAYTADAGCIEITYQNAGSIAHTLLVEGRTGFKLAVGTTDQGTIELPAGTYTLFCDVAGHRSAGMVADLVTS